MRSVSYHESTLDYTVSASTKPSFTANASISTTPCPPTHLLFGTLHGQVYVLQQMGFCGETGGTRRFQLSFHDPVRTKTLSSVEFDLPEWMGFAQCSTPRNLNGNSALASCGTNIRGATARTGSPRCGTSMENSAYVGNREEIWLGMAGGVAVVEFTIRWDRQGYFVVVNSSSSGVATPTSGMSRSHCDSSASTGLAQPVPQSPLHHDVQITFLSLPRSTSIVQLSGSGSGRIVSVDLDGYIVIWNGITKHQEVALDVVDPLGSSERRVVKNPANKESYHLPASVPPFLLKTSPYFIYCNGRLWLNARALPGELYYTFLTGPALGADTTTSLQRCSGAGVESHPNVQSLASSTSSASPRLIHSLERDLVDVLLLDAPVSTVPNPNFSRGGSSSTPATLPVVSAQLWLAYRTNVEVALVTCAPPEGMLDIASNPGSPLFPFMNLIRSRGHSPSNSRRNTSKQATVMGGYSNTTTHNGGIDRASIVDVSMMEPEAHQLFRFVEWHYIPLFDVTLEPRPVCSLAQTLGAVWVAHGTANNSGSQHCPTAGAGACPSTSVNHTCTLTLIDACDGNILRTRRPTVVGGNPNTAPSSNAAGRQPTRMATFQRRSAAGSTTHENGSGSDTPPTTIAAPNADGLVSEQHNYHQVSLLHVQRCHRDVVWMVPPPLLCSVTYGQSNTNVSNMQNLNQASATTCPASLSHSTGHSASSLSPSSCGNANTASLGRGSGAGSNNPSRRGSVGQGSGNTGSNLSCVPAVNIGRNPAPNSSHPKISCLAVIVEKDVPMDVEFPYSAGSSGFASVTDPGVMLDDLKIPRAGFKDPSLTATIGSRTNRIHQQPERNRTNSVRSRSNSNSSNTSRAPSGAPLHPSSAMSLSTAIDRNVPGGVTAAATIGVQCSIDYGTQRFDDALMDVLHPPTVATVGGLHSESSHPFPDATNPRAALDALRMDSARQSIRIMELEDKLAQTQSCLDATGAQLALATSSMHALNDALESALFERDCLHEQLQQVRASSTAPKPHKTNSPHQSCAKAVTGRSSIRTTSSCTLPAQTFTRQVTKCSIPSCGASTCTVTAMLEATVGKKKKKASEHGSEWLPPPPPPIPGSESAVRTPSKTQQSTAYQRSLTEVPTDKTRCASILTSHLMRRKRHPISSCLPVSGSPASGDICTVSHPRSRAEWTVVEIPDEDSKDEERTEHISTPFHRTSNRAVPVQPSTQSDPMLFSQHTMNKLSNHLLALNQVLSQYDRTAHIQQPPSTYGSCPVVHPSTHASPATVESESMNAASTSSTHPPTTTSAIRSSSGNLRTPNLHTQCDVRKLQNLFGDVIHDCHLALETLVPPIQHSPRKTPHVAQTGRHMHSSTHPILDFDFETLNFSQKRPLTHRSGHYHNGK